MARRPEKALGSARRKKKVRLSPRTLLGREQDIALVEKLIERVRVGGAALIISGDPGIGKSALLEVAQDFAQDRGMRVLRLCGVTSETHLPFGALQQALGSILKQGDTLPKPQRAALQAAFGLSEDTTAPDIFLVGLATLTLLTASRTRKPTLLVADDIQWLDQPSRDVLAFISRRISSDPIVLLMATRGGTEEAFTTSSVLRHELSGLDASAAERLLDAQSPDLPHDLRRRFLSEAAGNPLALVELSRGDRGRETGESPWLPLTDRLERAFFTRVTGLPTATRMLLLIIAENDSRSLREVLNAGEVLLGEKVGLEALTPAVSARLIELLTGEVDFRHPLVRSAVHQAASPAMRHNVHAALAQVIEDQSGRGIWHRMQSAIGPDEALAGELDAAATRSQRRGVLRTAIIALENAGRLSSTAVARSERLLRAAGFAADLGQAATVERLLREAELDNPQPHVRARFAWIREISQPLTVNDLGRISELVGFAADARARGDVDLAMGLLWRAMQRCWWSNAYDSLRPGILAAARALGSPDSDPRLIAIAAYAEPLENGYEVYQLLAGHSSAGVADPVDARILGFTGNTIGAYDYSIGWLTTASTALREQGRLGDLARVLFSRSCAETETGDWIGALRSSAEAARLGEETGQKVWVAAGTIVQAILAGRAGRFDAAEAHAGHAERLLQSPGTSFWRSMLQSARGIAALGAGRPAEAYEHMLRIWTPGDPAFNTNLRFSFLVDYVEAAVSCGHEAAGAAAVDEIERRSGRTAIPWVRVAIAYSKALLAAPDAAEKLFQDALAAEVQTSPFRRGCSLLAYGEWLRRQRRSADARAPLRLARDIFDALGAAPWSERARRELRAAGEASRPREGRMLDALTPQELQIAELATGGLSNKEIGIRLYLSHRTVGYHLHRIFSKAGITSRARLSRVLAGVDRPAG